MTAKTISVPAVASFGVSATGKDKLDLNFDGVSDYEITGSASNLTVDVNAADDCEVKLAGVTITNEAMDCFDIKNKCTAVDPATGDPIVPTVSISAKVDTVNTLKATAPDTLEDPSAEEKSGNSIESSCKLELKGRGTLNCGAVSTAISTTAKITIKNLTLNITSTGNRGIDTKELVPELDVDGNQSVDIHGNPLFKNEFYNLEIGANANITINSENDGIRCKNFDSIFIDAASGDVDSVINIASNVGDGIQLEGKGTNRAPLILHSGIVIVSGGQSPINNKSETSNIMIVDGTARLCRVGIDPPISN
ncbi:MAG: carbohydrate-binding domain-containing protein [Eubacterium sp.]